MAEGPDIVAVPGIAALPPTTTRQISSGQVLVDPSSVVKELIDNALDARAKSIFVDITANTLDSIQVKDDGHGIPDEDRPLVCRRYCTSKIRDFHDLREVGGKWLGFRGEALSSMAEMSGSLSVTTRVEGEPVAAKLKYDRNGELVSVEHESHPIGTTVKVTKFLDFIPVRKQTASKNSVKTLAKIRRLMQAYALARPTIRFRLRVLKSKNSNGDLVYAPKADANIEDAVLKVIGKDCALQCDWTALSSDGFEIHAFLPKPGANGPKIAHQGAFVSIDARPVSSSRGTVKQIVAAFKDRLRKSTPSLAGTKDPFFCMNIICPPDSYDPNIEPAKDDIMFDNSGVVFAVVDSLLTAYYPEAVQDIPDLQDDEIPTSAKQRYEPQFEDLPHRVENTIMIHEDEPTSADEGPPTNSTQALPRWRSSMYGIDEEDLDLLQENQAPVIEEEEESGVRAAEVSNPWTITRMNAAIKPKQAVSNEQLLSPAKSQRGGNSHLSSPSPAVTPRHPLLATPLTPQTSSRSNIVRSPLDAELERGIQHMPQPGSEGSTFEDSTRNRGVDTQGHHEFNTSSSSQTDMSNHFTQSDVNPRGSRLARSSELGRSSQRILPLVQPTPRNRRTQPAYANKPFAPPKQGSQGTGLGQYLPGTQPLEPARHKQQANLNEEPSFPANNSSSPCRPILNLTDRIDARLVRSNNNSDIRNFFARSRENVTAGSSVTSVHPKVPTHQLIGQPLPLSGRAQRLQPPSQWNALADDFPQSPSAELQLHSKRLGDLPLIDEHSHMGTHSQGMNKQYRADAERQSPPRASSVGSQVSILFGQRPAGVQSALDMREDDSARPGLRNTTHHFNGKHHLLPQSPTPGPSSFGTEHPPISQHPIQVPKPPGTHHPNQCAEKMEAYFRTQEQQYSSSPFRLQNTQQRQEPRISPAHETARRTRRPRRRTTDALERTKSSRLPLERTPKGFHIQHLIFPLSTGIHAIIQCSQKSDTQHNSPEWGYAAEDVCSVFAEPVFEKEIMQWVIKLDALLCKRYERMEGPDTRCEIHECIQRALDARKEMDDATQRDESMCQDTPRAVVDTPGQDVPRDDSDVVQHSAAEPEKKAHEDNEFDFDMEQFVDLTEEVERQILGTADEQSGEVIKSDYDDVVEDEMLMDL